MTDGAKTEGAHAMVSPLGQKLAVERFIPAGDHTIVLGRVTDGRALRSSEVLTSTYMGWPCGG